MKKIVLIMFTIAIALTSCSTLVTSKAEIIDFKIQTSSMKNTDNILCTVSGKTADSALWIKSYKIEYKGNSIYLTIEKSLKKTGISDPYFIQFIIPKDVQNLYLGKDELIWRRSN